jgi:hypothetical protein
MPTTTSRRGAGLRGVGFVFRMATFAFGTGGDCRALSWRRYSWSPPISRRPSRLAEPVDPLPRHRGPWCVGWGRRVPRHDSSRR